MIDVRNDGYITQVGSFHKHSYCTPSYVQKMQKRISIVLIRRSVNLPLFYGSA